MIATVIIENKEITVKTEPNGAIVPTHIDDRLIDFRSDNADSDFVALYYDEIVEAVEDEIEADKQERLVESLPY